jgi:hypothetical protein
MRTVMCEVNLTFRILHFALAFRDPPGIRTQDPRLKRAMLYLLS